MDARQRKFGEQVAFSPAGGSKNNACRGDKTRLAALTRTTRQGVASGTTKVAVATRATKMATATRPMIT